jgi:putative oxidoreductase
MQFMSQQIQGVTTILARVLLCTIFLLSAVGNKIPNFESVAEYMQSAGVPASKLMLAGAIAFLIVGSLSVLLGFEARIGAGLLLVFLALATYYFHAFWNLEGQEQQMQMIQFMKNLSMAGAMLFIIANGAGPLSFDAWAAKRKSVRFSKAPTEAELQAASI